MILDQGSKIVFMPSRQLTEYDISMVGANIDMLPHLGLL